MAKRSRRAQRISAPPSDYEDTDGNVLSLRGSLTAGSRQQYAKTLAGIDGRPSATQEDAWQRALELLFERLAVRWVIAGVSTEKPKELLARFRVASAQERAWVREAIREHCAEHFPDVKAP